MADSENMINRFREEDDRSAHQLLFLKNDFKVSCRLYKRDIRISIQYISWQNRCVGKLSSLHGAHYYYITFLHGSIASYIVSQSRVDLSSRDDFIRCTRKSL